MSDDREKLLFDQRFSMEGINTSNWLEIMSHSVPGFYDTSCSNQICRMQGLSSDKMK